MSTATPEQTDDLHLLMAIAVLCGQRAVDAPLLPIFDTWQREYPQDALGNLGRGLFLIAKGDTEAGIGEIETATTAQTRAEQAREVLNALRDAGGR